MVTQFSFYCFEALIVDSNIERCYHITFAANEEQTRPIAATVTWSRTLLQKSGDKDQRSGFGMQQGGRVRPVEPDNIADIRPLSAAVQHYRPAKLSPPANISNCPLVTAVPGGVERGLGDKQKDCEELQL